ncbi:MAG TPA: hypothetical protein VGB83_04635 [Actinomycetota bacterium]
MEAILTPEEIDRLERLPLDERIAALAELEERLRAALDDVQS